MSDRFFSNNPIDDETVVIDGDQAHHIRNVMRLKPGAEAVLFDGLGREFPSTIVRVDRREIEFQIQDSLEIDREIDRDISVACPLPKGDRQKFMVEKLVELGTKELVLVQSQRSVGSVTEKTIQKLNRYVIEACKQSGRNRLMKIMPEEQNFSEWVTNADPGWQCLIAHPYSTQPLSRFKFIPGGQYRLLVGPEGGFTDQEIELAIQQHWQAVSLGPAILRMETAAIVMATVAGIANLPN